MHIYSDYPAPSGRAIVEFVREHPFAVMATSASGAPVATHAPFVFPPVPPGAEPRDTLVGQMLWGHIGRGNPHWQLLAEQPEALLVFTSSHAYVSPTAYALEPAVPTVNYAAVHLTGRVEIIEHGPTVLEVVKQTVAQLEQSRDEPWDQEPSIPVYERILNGVVAFRIEIDSETAMFKLSQEMPEEVHARVAADLSRGEHRQEDVAELMRRVGVDGRPQPAGGNPFAEY